MLRHSLIITALLLTGCHGPGDRVVSRVPALVVIKNNAVCVLSPLKPDEKITGIQFYSSSGEKRVRTFHKQPVYAARGECLPVFGFAFVPDKFYAMAYDVETPDPGDYHLVTAEFGLLANEKGGLRVERR